MSHPSFKDLAKSNRPKIGTVVLEFDTPGIGQILKAAGLDFVFLDMEHSGFSFSDLKRTLRYTQSAELPALVRVPSDRYDHIARALDLGPDALMVPMVGSAEQARHIVSCAKYVPQGERGFAPQVAHDRYQPGPALTKMRRINRHTSVWAQIETAEGAENAETIAAVTGIDCLWVGHMDLSLSLGVPGQYKSPQVKRAFENVVSAAKKHKKSLGRMVQDVKLGASAYSNGFEFLAYHVDAWALHEFMQTNVEKIRKNCRKPSR
tara:strand:- start:311 stop:1099 length:789 start_codon:yes stop_codon:yes gene_type:complete